MTLLLLLLWTPVLLACGYLLLLSLLSRLAPRPAAVACDLNFEVIVPAHDEAAVIVRTLDSLKRLDWPAGRLRITVVADNCSDATAVLAHAAGVTVVERSDPILRGKGYALQLAFERALREGWADALVVVDADSVVSANLLAAFAARLRASDADALQAHYGVLNPDASWRTQLMTLAQTCFHLVRSRGRERLGLSCGLRGNGWCVSRRALAQVPYDAYSLAEDVEYGIKLGLAGYRVHYVDEAEVRGEMVSTGDAARSQRRRWEQGRQQLRSAFALPLLHTALLQRSRVCLDLAADLLLPPLSSVVLYVMVMAAIATLAGTMIWPAALCLLALGIHVFRGWQLSGLGTRALGLFHRVPVFMAWKLGVMLSAGVTRTWIRTRREAP